MSWIVLIRVEAEQDLAAAREWYEAKRTGLGDEFVDEFAANMRALEELPERERLLRQFPSNHF